MPDHAWSIGKYLNLQVAMPAFKRTMKRQKVEPDVKTVAGKGSCYGYEMLSNERIGEIPIDKL